MFVFMYNIQPLPKYTCHFADRQIFHQVNKKFHLFCLKQTDLRV
jgi:hypothetical protein